MNASVPKTSLRLLLQVVERQGRRTSGLKIRRRARRTRLEWTRTRAIDAGSGECASERRSKNHVGGGGNFFAGAIPR